MIHSQRDALSNLTIHTVEDGVTTEEIRKVIEGFHTGHPTLDVLWDFRQADVTHLAASDIERLADEVQQHAHVRAGGKTALVCSDDLWYGQSRMFQAHAELRHVPLAFSCFRTMEEALDWLGVSRAP